MSNADIIDILVEELDIDQNQVRLRINELERLGSEYHKICEEQCNFGSSPEMDDRQETLQLQAELAVSRIHPYISLYVNTDPRGYPFGLILPSGRSNNFGGLDWRLDIGESYEDE